MGQVTSKDKTEKKERTLKEIVRDDVWSKYPSEQMAGRAPDQTASFFQSLPSSHQNSFFSSTHRIVQFGVASGKFLQNPFLVSRERIGYDYTEASASIVPFEHRLVDLNETKDDKLTYEGLLEEDLSVPCDILLIRLLEYLDDNTATLLLTSLIATAKPGSVFYIDFNKTDSRITNHLSIGAIGQLFKPEENFETHLHSVHPEGGNEVEYGLTEQLVVTKCR